MQEAVPHYLLEGVQAAFHYLMISVGAEFELRINL